MHIQLDKGISPKREKSNLTAIDPELKKFNPISLQKLIVSLRIGLWTQTSTTNKKMTTLSNSN